MKTLKQYIQEGIKINSKSKVNSYNYKPNDKNELWKIINQLIKEKGNKADLNDIDTSEINDMSDLFSETDFNGDISRWNVSNVTNMKFMFYNSKFNGDINNWNTKKCTAKLSMFDNSPLEKNTPKWYKNNI